MNYIVSNISSVRRERVAGRDFLVAKVTLLVQGVANGSNGPLLYLAEDMRASANDWNGKPILLNHHSGSDPKVLDRFGLGLLQNVRANGALKGEAWIDIEKANNVDPRIVPLVSQGAKVEVSTGLFLQPEKTSGVFAGKHYEKIAKAYRPDHLAVLLDDRGACSVFDGCGLNN